MASDMDAYRASEDFPSSRGRRRRQRVSWRKRLLSILSVLFLVGVVIAVVVLLNKAGSNESTNANASNKDLSGANDSATNGSTNTNNSSNNDDANASSGCVTRRPAAHTRTVAFWQSEVAGCEAIPRGVTHVVFGFALVDGVSGRVVPTFQNTDDEIRGCVQTLRKNCIASLGSIGGSTNNDALANVTDASAFAASAVALVTKFGFDGIDIDDETVGVAFTATRAVAVVEATRTALTSQDPTLLLTYDAYFNEGEATFCANEANRAYTRCFPPALLASLDWVNIMAYNVAADNATAAAIYEKALTTTFVDWKTQLSGDFTKATIGVCVDRSCAYGPGPSRTVIASWNAFARTAGSGGGMMVYAASGEVAEDFAVTRSVLPRTP